jgi:hypothetical protein
MPSVTIELPRVQLDEVEAYALRHQLSVTEVIARALDRFLALARIEPDEISLMSKEQKGLLDHDL